MLILFLLVAGNILCDHFLHVYLCLLHCFQNEVLQLLLLCTQASDRPKQLALQWTVSKSLLNHNLKKNPSEYMLSEVMKEICLAIRNCCPVVVTHFTKMIIEGVNAYMGT